MSVDGILLNNLRHLRSRPLELRGGRDVVVRPLRFVGHPGIDLPSRLVVTAERGARLLHPASDIARLREHGERDEWLMAPTGITVAVLFAVPLWLALFVLGRWLIH